MQKNVAATIGTLAIAATVALTLAGQVQSDVKKTSTKSQSYFVPSGSMEPTLPFKSKIKIQKDAYKNVSQVRRGDVIIYAQPGHSKTAPFVRRVIGLPGDTIRISGTSVAVNDRELSRKRLESNRGDRHLYQESINSRSYRVAYLVKPPAPRRSLVVTVPKDSLFLLGDNRDNSNDSRFLGTLPFKSVIGKQIR